MSTTAMSLIRAVRERGGKITVEGEMLAIEPAEVGRPLAEELRSHKKEIIGLLREHGDRPRIDPEAWQEDFRTWFAARCISRDGRDDSCGVSALLADFAEWAIAYGSVPCTRRILEELLEAAGFSLEGGAARGLMLRGDLWALGHTSRSRGVEVNW